MHIFFLNFQYPWWAAKIDGTEGNSSGAVIFIYSDMDLSSPTPFSVSICFFVYCIRVYMLFSPQIAIDHPIPLHTHTLHSLLQCFWLNGRAQYLISLGLAVLLEVWTLKIAFVPFFLWNSKKGPSYSLNQACHCGCTYIDKWFHNSNKNLWYCTEIILFTHNNI